MISPKNETLEYLTTYLDYKDAIVVIYSLLIFIALYKFIRKQSMPSFEKKTKYLGYLSLVIILIGLAFYKHKAISNEPINILSKYISASKHSKLYNKRKEILKNIPQEKYKPINIL